MTSSNDLLAEIKGSQSQFNHSPTIYLHKVIQVLAPENYKWEDILINLYLPSEIPQTAPVGSTVIIHGHDRNGSCFSNTFCHILGYVPKDGGSKFWKLKWDRSATFVPNPFGKGKPSE